MEKLIKIISEFPYTSFYIIIYVIIITINLTIKNESE